MTAGCVQDLTAQVILFKCKLSFVKLTHIVLTRYLIVRDNPAATARAGVTPGTHATVGGKGPALIGAVTKSSGAATWWPDDCRNGGE